MITHTHIMSQTAEETTEERHPPSIVDAWGGNQINIIFRSYVAVAMKTNAIHDNDEDNAQHNK
eukprot:scaffold147354_cov36-Attheya_sp.AAC.2